MSRKQPQKLERTELDKLQEQKLISLNAIQEQQDRVVEETEELKQQQAQLERHVSALKDDSELETTHHLKIVKLRKEEEVKYKKVFSNVSELEIIKGELEAECESLKAAAKEDLELENSGLISEIRESKNKLAEQKTQLDKLEADCEEAEKKKAKLAKNAGEFVVYMRTSRDALMTLETDKERVEQEIASLTPNVKSLEDKIVGLQLKKESIELDITVVEETKRTRKSELNLLERKIDIESAKLKKIQDQMVGLLAREHRVNELTPKIKELYASVGKHNLNLD